MVILESRSTCKIGKQFALNMNSFMAHGGHLNICLKHSYLLALKNLTNITFPGNNLFLILDGVMYLRHAWNSKSDNTVIVHLPVVS